jgi:hypothetical protein
MLANSIGAYDFIDPNGAAQHRRFYRAGLDL